MPNWLDKLRGNERKIEQAEESAEIQIISSAMQSLMMLEQHIVDPNFPASKDSVKGYLDHVLGRLEYVKKLDRDVEQKALRARAYFSKSDARQLKKTEEEIVKRCEQFSAEIDFFAEEANRIKKISIEAPLLSPNIRKELAEEAVKLYNQLNTFRKALMKVSEIK